MGPLALFFLLLEAQFFVLLRLLALEDMVSYFYVSSTSVLLLIVRVTFLAVLPKHVRVVVEVNLLMILLLLTLLHLGLLLHLRRGLYLLTLLLLLLLLDHVHTGLRVHFQLGRQPLHNLRNGRLVLLLWVLALLC